MCNLYYQNESRQVRSEPKTICTANTNASSTLDHDGAGD